MYVLTCIITLLELESSEDEPTKPCSLGYVIASPVSVVSTDILVASPLPQLALLSFLQQ